MSAMYKLSNTNGRSAGRAMLGAVVLFAVSACALPTKTIEETQDFVPQDEINAATLAGNASDLFNSSRFVEAVGKFQLALRIAPQASNLKANLASAYERAGLLDEASKLYGELKASQPDAVRYNLALARIAAMEGNERAADSLYGDAKGTALGLMDYASAALADQSLAALYFKVGDVDNAICLAKTLREAKGDQESMLREAKFLISDNRCAEASSILAQFSAEKGLDRSPELLAQRALAAYGEGKGGTAAALATLALREPAIAPLDASTVKLVLALEGKLPVEEDQTEEEALQESVKPLLGANDANFLYWPVSLREKFEELRQETVEE